MCGAYKARHALIGNNLDNDRIFACHRFCGKVKSFLIDGVGNGFCKAQYLHIFNNAVEGGLVRVFALGQGMNGNVSVLRVA